MSLTDASSRLGAGSVRGPVHSVRAAPVYLRVQLSPWSQLDGRLLARWRELEQQAVEPDPCLAPHFVLPAIRYLGLEPPLVLTIERAGQLVALGLFYARRPTVRFPFAHLEAFRCMHSLLTSGFLFEPGEAPQALRAFCEFLLSARSPWCGIRICERRYGGLLDRFLATPGLDLPVSWYESARSAHAALKLRPGVRGTWPARVQSGMVVLPLGPEQVDALRESRCYRRQWRSLAAKGQAEWRIRLADAVDEATIERFLHLEDQGWKRAAGTSLRACPGHAEFFRAMIRGFRDEGRVYFVELVVAGEVIATTCHVVAGNVGFAFKVGWSEAHARFSPSLLNELLIAHHASAALPMLETIDACNAPGDYIETLWPERIEYTDGYLLAGWRAHVWRPVWHALRIGRHLKAWLRWRTPIATAPMPAARRQIVS